MHRYARVAQSIGSTQIGQIDHKQRRGNRSTRFANQFRCGQRGTTSGDQIIHQCHLRMICNGARIDLKPVHPIFELVIDPDGFPRELARLADRDKSYARRCRDCSAKNETARLHSGDHLGLGRADMLRQKFDTGVQRRRIGQ